DAQAKPFQLPPQSSPTVAVVIEDGEMRALRHEHHGLEAEGASALQEGVKRQTCLSRPDAGVTYRVQGRFQLHAGRLRERQRWGKVSGSLRRSLRLEALGECHLPLKGIGCGHR